MITISFFPDVIDIRDTYSRSSLFDSSARKALRPWLNIAERSNIFYNRPYIIHTLSVRSRPHSVLNVLIFRSMQWTMSYIYGSSSYSNILRFYRPFYLSRRGLMLFELHICARRSTSDMYTYAEVTDSYALPLRKPASRNCSICDTWGKFASKSTFSHLPGSAFSVYILRFAIMWRYV